MKESANMNNNTHDEIEHTNIETTDIDTTTESKEKRSSINSIFETPILPYKKSVKSIHFPKHIKKLSLLYSACLSVQKYNNQKNLKSIYIKSKVSIEKMIREEISQIDFERLCYLFDVKIKTIKILHEGKNVETFTFELPEIDYDLVFWEYIKTHYKKYLEANNLEHHGSRFISGFDVNTIDLIPRKTIFEPKIQAHVETVIVKEIEPKVIASAVKKGLTKAQTIFERIKEKERNRKEQFMKANDDRTMTQQLRRRLEQLFTVENKSSLKMTKIVKLLNLKDGLNYIKKVCSDDETFEIRTTNNELFVYKK